MSLLCGPAVPLQRFLIVLLGALSMPIHHTEIVLRPCIPLLRRHAVPPHSFLSVLWCALSMAIHDAHIELCPHMPLLRRLAVPFQCLLEVLRDTLSMTIHQPQIKLRRYVPLCGQRLPVVHRLSIVTTLIRRQPIAKGPCRRSCRPSHKQENRDEKKPHPTPALIL